MFSHSEKRTRPRGAGVWAPADSGAPLCEAAARLPPALCSAACWDSARGSSLPPQVLLFSSGLLSAQVASFRVGEPAHGRSAALLLGGQRRSYSPGCPTRGHCILCLESGFFIPPSGHSNQSWGGWMASFSLDMCTLPPAVWVVGRERATQG